MESSDHTAHLTRRRLLALLGGSAVSAGLLGATGITSGGTPARDRGAVLNNAVAAVLAPVVVPPAFAQARAPLASFQQATQAAFTPINSSLTFGAPSDIAAGWDGTAWAIDGQGAPHVYDPLSDSWQLHGSGIDAAVPAVWQLSTPELYFKASAVFIADGQHPDPLPIGSVWPQLPPSYKLGVKGAAWAGDKLVLFRSGTFVPVPWPPPTTGVDASTPAPAATPTPVETPTPGGTAIPTETASPSATATPAGTATPEVSGGVAREVYHAALVAAATTRPTATPNQSASPTAAATSTATPTAAATHISTPTATATATGSATQTSTPTPAASTTPAPTPTATASTTPISATPTTTSTATSTFGATPTPAPAPPGPPADYVATPLTSISGWPQTANWQHGIIDGVFTYMVRKAVLLRGGEALTITLGDHPWAFGTPTVAEGPKTIASDGDLNSVPADWQANGFTGFLEQPESGPVRLFYTSGAQVQVNVLEATSERALTRNPFPSSTPTTVPPSTPAAAPTGSPAPTGTPSPTTTDTAPEAHGALYYAALIAAASTTTPTATRGTTLTPTQSPTPQPSATPSPTPTARPAASATASTSPTATPGASATATTSPTPSTTAAPTQSATPAPTASTTPTTPSGTPTPSTTRPTLTAGAGLSYIASAISGWPASWHPRLQHAPSGRTSGLWAATVDGSVVSFDGSAWTTQPGDAISVGVGKDGAVFAVSKTNPQQLTHWNGTGFTQVATHSAALAQVSVGAQSQVWTRDSSNAVHQLSQGQLQPAAFLGSAADIAANHDGTLWSCTGSDPHAHRLATDLHQAPETVPASGTVQKVASTGFGAAHCLASQNGTAQLYRYDSPYVFRSSGSYIFPTGNPIEQGLGSLFFVTQSHAYATGAPEATYQVVAVDAHTGQELSRSAPAPRDYIYTAPVYDALHETIIVGLTVDPYIGTVLGPGQLQGLDARDLTRVVWSISLPPETVLGPGRPTLNGTSLCVSDNFGSLVMYDTGSTSTATTPTLRWKYSYPYEINAPQDRYRLAPPVIANGTVYAGYWVWSSGSLQLSLWKLDAATGTGSQTALPAVSQPDDPSQSEYWANMGSTSPLLATVPGAQQGQSRQMLFVTAGQGVWSVDVDAVTSRSYILPTNSAAAVFVVSGFAYANGVLWFGDTASNLYGLDAQSLTPTANTPAQFRAGSGIVTTPLLYRDAQGEAAVIFSQAGATDPGLIVYDPASGNQILVPTQGTNFIALAAAAPEGVVYGGGGVATEASSQTPVAQLFGIRVDEAVQQLRDFVVDSQLMQDFDDPSQPTHEPSGVARYQTHLTLVDGTKAPLNNTAVKLWADQPNTTVLVNGQSVTLGPDDDKYAVVKTGADGTLAITSGSTQRDSTGTKFVDGADMTAVPLRAWAQFMDPYERMVIYRDREFHNRVSTAHASTPTQPGADDPTRANLQTAQAYGAVQKGGANTGTALFTDEQKQQNQPQNVANAIAKMTSAVGTTPPKSSKSLKASWSLRTVDTPGKYIVYTDTPGAQYSPVNVAGSRPAVVLQMTGLSYTSSNDGSAPLVYTTPSPAEATMAIDALDGQEWLTSVHATARVKAAAQAGRLHLGSWWDDFWSWLKGAAATVTHVIISVGEDIYLGIRAVADGIAHVFRMIISGIEEVANAIGAFFIQLGRLIEEIIEALSVLFQFGHIIDTHNILKTELLNRINGVPGNASYPGLASLLTGTVRPKLDAFFENSEQTVADALDNLANQLGGAPPTALAGGGSTAHSAFTATPRSGGSPATTGPQSAWGMQKLGGGVGGGRSVSSAARVLRAGAQDPADAIGTFFSAFAESLSSDPALSNQWAKVQQGAQSLGNAGSAENFLKQALAELLRIVALLVDGILAVSKALMDGLVAAIGSLIPAMFDPNDGILTAPLDIPVLSWLYQLLFGEPLTMLNALMLVVAIPLTIMWRIIEGKWPADSWSVGAARPRALAAQALSPANQLLMGYSTGLFSLFGGLLFARGDIKGAGDVPVEVGRAALVASLTTAGFSVPIYGSDNPSDLAWSAWGLGVGISLLNLLGSVDLSSAPASLELGKLGPTLLCILSSSQTFVEALIFHAEPPPNPLGDAALGLSIASALPGIINPLKLQSELGAAVVAVLDVVMGIAAGVAAVLGAYSNTS
ncbi:MAG: PQQ-like beta-propeller repeat protein [Chloroflexi bacterium]|nr:PQQ-like beta-propeller repeat protein [Chloroflexota bacterium]